MEKRTTNYGILETEEQKQARKKLLEDFGLGDVSYKDPLGSYDKTALEAEGENQLMRVLRSSRPELFGVGSEALKGLLVGDTFDPYNEKGSFAGFKDSVLREGQEASDRLRRSAAMVGNLYSTDTVKRLGDVEGDVGRALTSELGRQYELYTGRKLAAIPLAFQAAQAQEGMDIGRATAGLQYGGLDRVLQDQEFKDAYGEFVRAQGVNIGALSRAAGEPRMVETDSTTVTEEDDEGNDPWGRVLDMLAYGGGMGLASWAAKT